MGSADLISWSTAQRVAGRVSGSEPFSVSYLADAAERDLIACTRRAEEFILDATGLQSDGTAKIQVADRAGWVCANIGLFQRVMRPLVDRFESKPPSRIATQITGGQFGLILGWMSTRVLGQYDLLLDPHNHPEDQDILYYVMPNILTLEKRYAFPPNDFRLWIALHECTHRAQFTGVSWLPAYFRSLVEELLSDVDADFGIFTAGIKQILGGNRSGNSAGAFGYFATEKQKAIVDKLTGLMALLEGHADVTMSRAAGNFIPEAERFQRVMNHRRTHVTGVTKIFQRLLGIEAKLRQYIEGAGFVREVEEAGGRELFDSVWQRPEHLPVATEIRDPQKWIQRMRTNERVRPQ